MSNVLVPVLAAAATVVSLVALGLAVLAAHAAGVRRRPVVPSPLPTDVAGLRDEVERLRREAGGALRRVAVVRYDAFGDMGGRVSWSLALADDDGNGVVLTAIHARSDARSYAKSLVGWAGQPALSPEEEAAVGQAKAGVAGLTPA